MYADRIIPILLKDFADKSLTENVRVKLGEALLFVAKRCGETLPKYGKLNIPLSIHPLQPTTSLMLSFMEQRTLPCLLEQAVCLILQVFDLLVDSEKVELCKHMHFALHPFIVEILNCLNAMLTTEKEPEVRRGKK